MKIKPKLMGRILGNWLTSFLSPFMGMTIAFNLPFDDQNTKILISALIGSLIVTGLVVARELEKWGHARK